jgi:hypothetical protein
VRQVYTLRAALPNTTFHETCLAKKKTLFKTAMFKLGTCMNEIKAPEDVLGVSAILLIKVLEVSSFGVDATATSVPNLSFHTRLPPHEVTSSVHCLHPDALGSF